MVLQLNNKQTKWIHISHNDLLNDDDNNEPMNQVNQIAIDFPCHGTKTIEMKSK